MCLESINSEKIGRIALAKYNHKKAVVFNTLQLYRHDRLDYLHKELKAAKSKATLQWSFAGTKPGRFTA